MAFLKHTELFDSLNNLAVKIDEKKKVLGTNSLSWPEQVVDKIWTALGVIENGSFQYFIECQMDTNLVAQAYDEIGLKAVGDLFRQADALLSPVSKDTQWDRQLRFMQQHEQELDDLATKVLGFTSEMELQLSEYIKRNDQIFSRL